MECCIKSISNGMTLHADDVKAARTLRVTEAVMKKLSNLESVSGEMYTHLCGISVITYATCGFCVVKGLDNFMLWLGWHTDVMHNFTGLRAIAEVDVPPVVDFAKDYEAGQLRRLLALECVQDPGNLVISFYHSSSSPDNMFPAGIHLQYLQPGTSI